MLENKNQPMKAEEKITYRDLRIGNFVRLIRLANEDCDKIIEINNFSVLDEFAYGIREFQGITLSPSWLERAGFEFHKMENKEKMMQNGWDDLSYHFIKLRSGKEFQIFSDGSCSYCETESGQIKFVHELQNIIYALTQTELKFNP